MRIEDIFTVEPARSKGTNDYEDGNVPFVTNTTINNGVAQYVTPNDNDKVFEGKQICISGLGFATVQVLPFLPKGNGGDSATILTSKSNMGIEELIVYAAMFNYLHGWRFSYGRKCSVKRVRTLLMPSKDQFSIDEGDLVKSFFSDFRSSLLATENDL